MTALRLSTPMGCREVVSLERPTSISTFSQTVARSSKSTEYEEAHLPNGALRADA